jgi:hypothetical protein
MLFSSFVPAEEELRHAHVVLPSQVPADAVRTIVSLLEAILGFVLQCLVTLGINHKPNDASLVLHVIRALFDRVDDIGPFFTEPGGDEFLPPLQQRQ